MSLMSVEVTWMGKKLTGWKAVVWGNIALFCLDGVWWLIIGVLLGLAL